MVAAFVMLCWLATIVSICAGAIAFILGLAEAKGAPQHAAAAAIAVADAVIPYCFTRALSEIGRGVPDTRVLKKCPLCAESIKVEAKACRYCGRDLPLGHPAPNPGRRTAQEQLDELRKKEQH